MGSVNAIFAFPDEGYCQVEWERAFNEKFGLWKSIALYGGYYNPSASMSSKILDPILRLLHRFLSYTALGKGHSNSVIGLNDLFLLWCMNNRKKVNGVFFCFAHILSNLFLK
ncbi:hypothetical protein P3X46_033602 [Hevea brasiliensis]|uniref:Uncharacterized protein n=1 Tax=Hevea brasiliensis TaxID=3981 RepID=A0ABQ9KEP8_HEVBR|nr:hypothetical protein P3X46_033602 [Hevea brasiliensis]